MTINGYIYQANGGVGGNASAYWSDSFIITPFDTSLIGTLGTFNVGFNTLSQQSADVSANVQGSYRSDLVGGTASYLVSYNSGVASVTNFGGGANVGKSMSGRDPTVSYSFEHGAPLLSISIPFLFGSPIDISYGLSSTGSVTASYDGTADLQTTYAIWLGDSSVQYSSNGVSFTLAKSGYTAISSSSGINYANPIPTPIPAAFWLFSSALALFGLIGQRRQN
jgi:hypothetical protein